MAERIYLASWNLSTSQQNLAMMRIALNSGLSVIQLNSNETVPPGAIYLRLELGWIRVGRGVKVGDQKYNEIVYMHPEQLDMDTMTPETVKTLVLPLKEIMDSLGAYQAKPVDQHSPSDPMDLNYLMKRLRFHGEKQEEDGEIVSVEDVEPVTKKEQ